MLLSIITLKLCINKNRCENRCLCSERWQEDILDVGQFRYITSIVSSPSNSNEFQVLYIGFFDFANMRDELPIRFSHFSIRPFRYVVYMGSGILLLVEYYAQWRIIIDLTTCIIDFTAYILYLCPSSSCLSHWM